MTSEECNDLYFKWLYGLVYKDTRILSYHKLLRYLFDREFTYLLPMDGNRYEDGINLRYRFGDEEQIDPRIIASLIDINPCSVLEMMIALAIRCEEHIMDDPDYGNRTGQWFWNMINNLGLGNMNDRRFDYRVVKNIIDIFLNREYSRDGEGGLFVIHDSQYDLRNVDIWYQMMWYLNKFV